VIPIGMSLFNFFEPHQHERLKGHLANLQNDPQIQGKYYIYNLVDKQGDIISCYTYVTNVQSKTSGEMYRSILILPNLSNHSLPFTSFDTKELFLSQLSKNEFGTFEWLLGANEVFWSDGVYAIYGVDTAKKDITYQFANSFVHQDDMPKAMGQLQLVLEHGKPLEMEFRIITTKGEVKFIHVLLDVIKDVNNNVIKLFGSVRNVTEQKQMERSIKRNVEELNRSNKELENFAYVASHDLQEPLRKITTFGERLATKFGDVLNDEGLMYLSRMNVSADNMRSLINDLLEFSRIAKSNQTFSPVDLNFVLQQVKTDLDLIIEETGTVIICTEPLPNIESNFTHMKQLFANLINNAIKFRKQGVPPEITISSNVLTLRDKLKYNLVPGETYYSIEIKDNGIGFEEEYGGKIFRIFERLHGKSEYPGSGIGLAICKKIIEHHNGIIYADSTPGVGASFISILPAKNINKSLS